MSIITIGIDLAKNVFAVHGVDHHGKAVLIRPKVARAELLPLISFGIVDAPEWLVQCVHKT
jgi:transposase